jgi:hypothetical protein
LGEATAATAMSGPTTESRVESLKLAMSGWPAKTWAWPASQCAPEPTNERRTPTAAKRAAIGCSIRGWIALLLRNARAASYARAALA